MNGLAGSGSRWNVIANQVMMAQMAVVANGVRTFSLDQWNGYAAARARLMKFLADARPSNPIVITGDIHTNWVADLKLDFDDPTSPVVGTELVGTSVTSGGDGSDSTEGGERTLAENPHLKFFNSQRGYVRCTLTPSSLTAAYRTLAYITRPDAPIHTRATFVVENGRPGALATAT